MCVMVVVACRCAADDWPRAPGSCRLDQVVRDHIMCAPICGVCAHLYPACDPHECAPAHTSTYIHHQQIDEYPTYSSRLRDIRAYRSSDSCCDPILYIDRDENGVCVSARCLKFAHMWMVRRRGSPNQHTRRTYCAASIECKLALNGLWQETSFRAGSKFFCLDALWPAE